VTPWPGTVAPTALPGAPAVGCVFEPPEGLEGAPIALVGLDTADGGFGAPAPLVSPAALVVAGAPGTGVVETPRDGVVVAPTVGGEVGITGLVIIKLNETVVGVANPVLAIPAAPRRSFTPIPIWPAACSGSIQPTVTPAPWVDGTARQKSGFKHCDTIL